MSVDSSTSQLLSGYSRFFHRYHVVLFVVIAFGGLAIVILSLSQTAQSSTDTSAVTEAAATGFDKQTIQRLEGLKTTSSSQPLQFPSGRINPFVE